MNPDQALARRNDYVLLRMADEGFISHGEAEEAAGRPLVVRGRQTRDRSIAPYFGEEIRKVLERDYGADALYEAGLRVQTTLDAGLQAAANLAIDRGLRRIDKRRSGYRKPERNVVAEGHAVNSFTTARWTQPMLAGDVVPAVVTAVPPRGGRRRAYPCRAARTGIASQGVFLDAARLSSRSLPGGRPDRGGNQCSAQRRA